MARASPASPGPPETNGFPAFAPEGSRLVFRSGRGWSKNLAIMDADGSNFRPLTAQGWSA
jgi:Tol biopolymer transport system component